MSVRLRFAPSPTGYVHIGSLRTALYNYLYAKSKNGEYILRIEDTDRSRYVEGALENLIKSLEWAGIVHDEGVFLEKDKIIQKGSKGPYIQSERLELYNEYIEKLIHEGTAYYCFCSKERLDKVRDEQRAGGETPMYDKKCRNLSRKEVENKIQNGEEYVIRMKIPENIDIKFNDLIRGEISIHSSEIDDQVLIKSDGFPTYHFAVVIDDHFMDISHVVRGEEWLTATPKQVILFNYFGWPVPDFVHLPTVLNKEKKKLSKRQGDVAVSDFVSKGYLPEALVNYLALVGWSPPENKELFTIEELVEVFSFDRVSKTGGVFDIEKLKWINQNYIRKADNERLMDLSAGYLIESGFADEKTLKERKDWILEIIDMIKEKLSCLSEITEHIKIFSSGWDVVLEDEEAIESIKMENVGLLLEKFIEKLKETDDIDEEFVKNIFKVLQNETGCKGKNLYMPLRVAVTGQVHGPDLGKIFALLGKDMIIERVKRTMKMI